LYIFRTLALYLCIGLYTAVFGIPLIIIALILPKKYNNKFLISTWNKPMLIFIQYVGGVNYKIIGLEKLKNEPGVVILSNHQSMLETILYQDIFFPSLHVAKSSLRFIPIFGWGLTMIGTVYINRSKKYNARQQIYMQGDPLIKNGCRLVIYPEGTRVGVNEQKKYKTGGAQAAIEFQCNIIPVAHNAGEYWNKKGISKLGTATFIIGDAISTKDKSARELTNLVQTWTLDQEKKLNESSLNVTCHSNPSF
jgi:1-acyl-sn-glycerol-3-phosphate acyltransferase